MLRVLDDKEIVIVSGGMMEDGEILADDAGGGDYGDYDNGEMDYSQIISQDLPSPTNENGDIIVTATQEQVNDARIAYGEAEIVVNAIEYGSMAGGVLIGASELAWGAKVVGGLTGGGATLITADNKAAITNSVANAFYYKNREDPYGQYDAIP